MLPLRVGVDLRAMTMKEYSAFLKAPALVELHHQIIKYHIKDTRWGNLISQLKCSRCILQPQLTRLHYLWLEITVYYFQKSRRRSQTEISWKTGHFLRKETSMDREGEIRVYVLPENLENIFKSLKKEISINGKFKKELKSFNNRITEITMNVGILRRLAVTWSPVKAIWYNWFE